MHICHFHAIEEKAVSQWDVLLLSQFGARVEAEEVFLLAQLFNFEVLGPADIKFFLKRKLHVWQDNIGLGCVEN